jgi:Arc/MetJ family transcription regulator
MWRWVDVTRWTLSLVLVAALAAGQSVSPPPPGPIDPALVRETVEALATVVNREYVDADVAARVDASLRRSLADGRYAGVRTLEALRAALTSELFAMTQDKHLAVALTPEGGPGPTSTASADDAREVVARRSNFGIRRVEILPGNVGYLDLTCFYRLSEAREAVSAAMRLLRNADALIIDLRANGGGSPDTVAFLASYLFDTAGLALFEIVPRGEGGGRYATEATLLPDRNGQRPMYVLTAARTFSAGEGLAFLLQERRRAEVVGEKTAGAANPGRPYPLNAHFSVTVPNGRVRTALSGRNWEGAGVAPDVAAPAADALWVAHTRALRVLLERAPQGPWYDLLQQHLKGLERETRP